MKTTSREMLLKELKREPGQWVSGRYLSERLAVSRCAVWKQAAALKEGGYIIEASPRKGYRLQGVPDLLTPEEIRDGLGTELFGQLQIHHRTDVDSTNLLAKELALRGAPEGTLVVAEGQTAGRGRRGRGWYSPRHEGIYLSLILRPTLTPVEAPRITMAATIAAVEAVTQRTGLPVTVKWPNDLMVNGRKLGGILTELFTDPDRVEYVIVGLGLNVNIPREGFPPELRPTATSILAEAGMRAGRAEIVRRYLEVLEKSYLSLATGGLPDIVHRWRTLVGLAGRRVHVDLWDTTLRGRVVAMDADGALVLRGDGGETHRLHAGDLQEEEDEP